MSTQPSKADKTGLPNKTVSGNYFEDFRIGQQLVHATPRTLTVADASLYLALTGSRNPVHCAEPIARAMGHPSAPLDDLLVFHAAFSAAEAALDGVSRARLV